MLRLFNSLTRSKEEFKSLKTNRVSMYVCGITPNNATHLGHAFTYVSFDVLVRYLKYKGYVVDYLQNATDINDSDDVIAQAARDGRTWEEEAQYWINHFHKQMDALHVLQPNKYVLASSIVNKIIEINTDLLKKGFAYEKGGNLYFDITRFASYGQLSRFTPDQMITISRDRGGNPEDPHKKNPLDFVLWFGSNEKPNWDSPFGPGRPGWHIECSTMIGSILGKKIDIHGGGRDLIYPHHESEIAQAESATGESPFVAIWMHTAMVLYECEKMSKSLGNLVLVEDLLKKYSSDAIRWMILSHHYREPWEFEEYELEQVEKKISDLKSSMLDVRERTMSDKLSTMNQFEELMDDDLNTPKVLDLVEQLVEKNKNQEAAQILNVLGFRIA